LGGSDLCQKLLSVGIGKGADAVRIGLAEVDEEFARSGGEPSKDVPRRVSDGEDDDGLFFARRTWFHWTRETRTGKAAFGREGTRRCPLLIEAYCFIEGFLPRTDSGGDQIRM
jgi:hypothetical protein